MIDLGDSAAGAAGQQIEALNSGVKKKRAERGKLVQPAMDNQQERISDARGALRGPRDNRRRREEADLPLAGQY